MNHGQPRENMSGKGNITINSTAFPKVALINAPSKSPNASDSLSDASDTAAESGIMAKKLKIEVDIEFQWRTPEVRPSGAKTQSAFMLMSSAVLLTIRQTHNRC